MELVTVREFTKADIERLVDIWLDCSVQAHDFIDSEYWASKKNDMAQVYLPMSQTFVAEYEGEIVGFVSMVDTYLAALFVDNKYQQRGIGKKLLDHVKQACDTISLKVFEKNANAVRFYSNNGFSVAEELVEEETNQPEFAMVWKSSAE